MRSVYLKGCRGEYHRWGSTVQGDVEVPDGWYDDCGCDMYAVNLSASGLTVHQYQPSTKHRYRVADIPDACIVAVVDWQALEGGAA